MSSDAARKALEEAVARIHAEASGAAAGTDWDRASVAPCGDLLRVAYHGDPWAEGCDVLFETLARPSIARFVASIELSSPDVGANGTCDWELDALLPHGTTYPALTTFRIARGDPYRNNRLVVVTPGRDGGDGGALARLCDAAPRLQMLETPSAPDGAFLARKREMLRTLEVNAGYDHAGFVLDLAARGAVLPSLETFAWGDYVETYNHDWRTRTTPREDYVALFRSQTFARLRWFGWRFPPFSDADVDGLLRRAQGPTVRIERAEHRYPR
jgi:hypothetical protein